MKKLKQMSMVMLVGIMMSSLTACSTGGAKDGNDWSKNVEIQVPAKAGGGTDIMARTLANKIAKDAGNTITVVNNTDGGGIVAAETVRTAKTDGSKMLQWHSTMLIKTATGIYDKSAGEDFTVIAASRPKEKALYVLVASTESEYKTLDDLTDAAKGNPGKLLFGVETGGSSHIMTGMLAKGAGIDVQYVEAGSDTEKLTALVGKSIDACLVNINQAKQYIEAGKVVALGVMPSGDKGDRSSVLPETPNFMEQGIDVSFSFDNLFLGPKDMNPELVKKIYDYYVVAAASDEVNEIFEPSGFTMEFYPQDEALERVKKSQETINEIVELLDLKQK